MRPGSGLFPLEAGADPRLLRFLDLVSEPLERTLSPTELAEYRLQALAHLESLASDLREYDGFSPDDSVERALREYGRADLLAIGLLDERCKGTRPVGFARGARSATFWSFVWFGLASALSLLLTQIAALVPGMAWLAPFAVASCWITPLVAGVLCGLTVPTGNLQAVCVSLLILVAHAMVIALLTNPTEAGSTFVRFQAVAWPPLGCTATYLTALLRRRPRFRPHDRLVA